MLKPSGVRSDRQVDAQAQADSLAGAGLRQRIDFCFSISQKLAQDDSGVFPEARPYYAYGRTRAGSVDTGSGYAA